MTFKRRQRKWPTIHRNKLQFSQTHTTYKTHALQKKHN